MAPMSRIFITGSTGFLGSEIVRQAVEQGHEVTALHRKTSSLTRLNDLKINLIEGDVSDLQSLKRGMEGTDFCIHTAGDTSYFLKDRTRQQQINVVGVKNIVTAAHSQGIRRLIHTSSVAAIGFDPAGSPVDETAVWNWPFHLPYMETKRDGEIVARSGASDRMEVIVLNPATVMGPGGMNASEEQLVQEVKSNRIAAIPCGGMTVCDVKDVAGAHLLALKKGRSGERYILGGHHVSHEALMKELARKFNVKLTAKRAPRWLLNTAGGAILQLEKLGLSPPIPAAVLRLASYGIYHSSEKAITELDYRPSPYDSLIERVCNYYLAAEKN